MPSPRRDLLFVVALLIAITTRGDALDTDALDDEATAWLEGLGAPTVAEREEAEAALVALAESPPDAAERVLKLLPEPSDAIPPEVQAAIQRVRIRIQAGVARRATAASRVTLQVTQAPLAEVLADITLQTGVRFDDQRAPEGGAAPAGLVTLSLKDRPFWEAIDKLADEADLSVYRYGDGEELTLVPRPATEGRRFGVASYAGPFRFEATELTATRGVRDAGASRLDLTIEAAWEPRLRPIALAQPMASVIVESKGGGRLAPRTPGQSIDLEASPGQQGLDMTLSFDLPPRKLTKLTKVAGELTALIPATPHTFRFDRLGEAKLPTTQTFGAATVTIDRFTKVNEVWELHMRLALADAGDSLASHRGWFFQNPSHLLTAKGEKLDHIGYETTLLRQGEVGIAYLFDLTDPAAEGEQKDIDPKTLTWVYETPTGVFTIPVRWELGPIELP